MPDYALIQGVFIGCVSAYVVVLALIGPENHGSHFERGRTALEAGASNEDVGSMPEHSGVLNPEWLSTGSLGAKEKDEIQLVETKSAGNDRYAV